MDASTISFKLILSKRAQETASEGVIFCSCSNFNIELVMREKTHCCARVKETQGIAQVNCEIL